MEFLPEWAPSIHPMLVHFPIALLFVAVLIDVIAFVLRGQHVLRVGAVGLYVLGALGALASVLSGQRAAEGLQLPKPIEAALEEHEEWGERTVWFFGIYAVVRLGELWVNSKPRPAAWVALLLIACVGLFVLYETGEHGAELVFEYGVGVQAVD